MACPACAVLKSLKTVQSPFSKASLLQSLFQRFLFAKLCCKGKPFFKGSSFAKVPMQRQPLFQRHLFAKVVLLFASPCLHIFSLSAIASGLLKESMILSKTQLYCFDFFFGDFYYKSGLQACHLGALHISSFWFLAHCLLQNQPWPITLQGFLSLLLAAPSCKGSIGFLFPKGFFYCLLAF